MKESDMVKKGRKMTESRRKKDKNHDATTTCTTSDWGKREAIATSTSLDRMVKLGEEEEQKDCRFFLMIY